LLPKYFHHNSLQYHQYPDDHQTCHKMSHVILSTSNNTPPFTHKRQSNCWLSIFIIILPNSFCSISTFKHRNYWFFNSIHFSLKHHSMTVKN
jgi:hypothetical protein